MVSWITIQILSIWQQTADEHREAVSRQKASLQDSVSSVLSGLKRPESLQFLEILEQEEKEKVRHVFTTFVFFL